MLWSAIGPGQGAVCSSIRASLVALPKRWIIERTLAWISRNRRLARDFERNPRTIAAFVQLAIIRVMLKPDKAKPLLMSHNFPDRLSESGISTFLKKPARSLREPRCRR